MKSTKTEKDYITCPVCKALWYCSEKCQTEDKESHSTLCSMAKAASSTTISHGSALDMIGKFIDDNSEMFHLISVRFAMLTKKEQDVNIVVFLKSSGGIAPLKSYMTREPQSTVAQVHKTRPPNSFVAVFSLGHKVAQVGCFMLPDISKKSQDQKHALNCRIMCVACLKEITGSNEIVLCDNCDTVRYCSVKCRDDRLQIHKKECGKHSQLKSDQTMKSVSDSLCVYTNQHRVAFNKAALTFNILPFSAREKMMMFLQPGGNVRFITIEEVKEILNDARLNNISRRAINDGLQTHELNHVKDQGLISVLYLENTEKKVYMYSLIKANVTMKDTLDE